VLGSISSLLGWDERTMMPAAENEYRAEQMTLLSGLIYDRVTDARYGEQLEELAASDLMKTPHSDAAAIIRGLKRDRDKRVQLPKSLVEELTRAAVRGQQAWEKARRDDDYALFKPALETLLQLKRQQADAYGYENSRYDALLDEYEPEAKTADVDRVLRDLRDQLVPLVEAIRDSKTKPNLDVLRGTFPIADQEAFGRAAAQQIGFDFDRGRLDVTAHPFCSGMGPHDCRLTTRYDEQFFPSAFFGTLHEAGHGIYEQGQRPEEFGLPSGDSISLGIHESQSRMWENQVGRSASFWKHFFPKLQETFPKAVSKVELDDYYFAINNVEPSLIRVEADEATYNLHILIRFEIEQLLLSDDLPLDDLPAAWNERYEQYLGITPPSDAAGVLQDVHWSFGAFGYFPTYSLGNLYSAQFYDQAEQEIGPLDEQFAEGQFGRLKQWLNEKIHEQGRRYTASELIEQVTGKPLSHEPLVRYLRDKLTPLYNL